MYVLAICTLALWLFARICKTAGHHEYLDVLEFESRDPFDRQFSSVQRCYLDLFNDRSMKLRRLFLAEHSISYNYPFRD